MKMYDNGSKFLGVKKDIINWINHQLCEKELDGDTIELYCDIRDMILNCNFEDDAILVINYDLPNDFMEISAFYDKNIIE